MSSEMASYPKRRFFGTVGKRCQTLGIVRIERVRGATAVAMREYDETKDERYVIQAGRVVRPDRSPEYHFLVATTGAYLTFESDKDKVYVEGYVIDQGTGPELEASKVLATRQEPS